MFFMVKLPTCTTNFRTVLTKNLQNPGDVAPLNSLQIDELGEGALDVVEPCKILRNAKVFMATLRAATTRHHNAS